jgi:hypothetical protein
MDAIAPRPIPSSLQSEPAREGWNGATLATPVEQVGDGPHAFRPTFVASQRAVYSAFQYQPSYDVNGPTFEYAGTSLADAISAARARSERSFQDAPRSDGDVSHQAQAVLQAASGAYYVTALAEGQRGTPIDLSHGWTVAPADLHEDVRAIVGHDTWIPAPGVAEQLDG